MSQPHAFSIDLEDWYHGIELPQESWKGKEYRLEKGLDVILELLEPSRTKITFFCLGWIGTHYGKIIKKLAEAGHEIASHCYSHSKIYNLSRDEFREEIRKTKSVLEDLSGQPVVGNRAPYFSITQKSLWALEIIKEEGYEYDCSISPVVTWRYGIQNSPSHVYRIKDCDLVEFPVSTTKLLGKDIVIGGAYFRIFPYLLFRHAFKKARHPLIFYAHPWEYDPHHPSVTFDLRARMTHYFNLEKMAPKTRKLLSSFQFQTISETIAAIAQQAPIREVTLEELHTGTAKHHFS